MLRKDASTNVHHPHSLRRSDARLSSTEVTARNRKRANNRMDTQKLDRQTYSASVRSRAFAAWINDHVSVKGLTVDPEHFTEDL